METRRILVLNANNKTQANKWIARQGWEEEAFTVPLWLLSDDPAVDPPAAFWCNWNLRDSAWPEIRDRIEGANWKVNSTDPDNDISHYLASEYTPQQVLDDTTRKGWALKVDDTVTVP